MITVQAACNMQTSRWLIWNELCPSMTNQEGETLMSLKTVSNNFAQAIFFSKSSLFIRDVLPRAGIKFNEGKGKWALRYTNFTVRKAENEGLTWDCWCNHSLLVGLTRWVVCRPCGNSLMWFCILLSRPYSNWQKAGGFETSQDQGELAFR